MSHKIFYTCCFTGHRPKNLPWGYNEKGIRFLFFKLKLYFLIKKLIKQGYTHFISGMALGVDIICAELILKIKSKNKNISLECAIPCKNQTKLWNIFQKKRYTKICSQADKITYITNTTYTNSCMQKRNCYMIDNSNLVVAVYTNKSGGTAKTLEYAKSKNKKIIIIKP